MKIKIMTGIILIMFIIANIIPSISGIQVKENERFPLSFDPPVYSSTPDWISDNPHYSTGAAFADFNQNGWLDLVVADGNDISQGRLNVYYNDGNGAFPTTASWQSADLGYNGHLDVADVNGDG